MIIHNSGELKRACHSAGYLPAIFQYEVRIMNTGKHLAQTIQPSSGLI